MAVNENFKWDISYARVVMENAIDFIRSGYGSKESILARLERALDEAEPVDWRIESLEADLSVSLSETKTMVVLIRRAQAACSTCPALGEINKLAAEIDAAVLNKHWKNNT